MTGILTTPKARRRLRVASGVSIWIALLVGLYQLVQDRESRREVQAFAHVRSWILSQELPVILEFPRRVGVEVGDPVFFRSSQKDITLVGEIRELLENGETLPFRAGWVRRVLCEIHASGHVRLNSSSRATLISVPQTTAWVVKTLLPRERLLWVAEEWNRTLLEHREEVFDALDPLLQDLLVDFHQLIVDDLPDAINRHREELADIGRRFQVSLFEKELRPILQEEIWPILLQRAQPTLDAVGKEVLQKLPVWSLTWRLLYQNLPLTANHYVKNEWNRFVDAELLPILKSHMSDFFGAFQDVVAEAARNPRIGEAFRHSFEKILRDRALQHEIRLIFQEIVLDNPRFHDAMLARWKSPEMSRALEKLSVFIGPLLSRIGDTVLGTRGGGITPEFARVLRTQILEKDRRWILIEPGSPGAPPMSKGQVFKAEVMHDG